MSTLAHIIGNDPFLQIILWIIGALIVSLFLSFLSDRIVTRIINVLHDQKMTPEQAAKIVQTAQENIAARSGGQQLNRRKGDV